MGRASSQDEGEARRTQDGRLAAARTYRARLDTAPQAHNNRWGGGGAPKGCPPPAPSPPARAARLPMPVARRRTPPNFTAGVTLTPWAAPRPEQGRKKLAEEVPSLWAHVRCDHSVTR